MIKKIICAAVLTASVSLCSAAQTASPTPQMMPQATPAPVVGLETILAEAAKQTDKYRATFNDLLATEIKTFEKFGKNGDVKDQTVIESNFFVYQSSKDGKTSSELRNVIKADNELVPESQARADRFLAELQKTSTVEKELEKIQDEGLRYDKTFKISGLTLYEAIALSDNLRSVFDFKLLGTETYQGREVYVVGYQQTRKSPFITVNEKKSKEQGLKVDFDASLPGSLKKTDAFLRGKLWVDAQTFQIWREERQLAVQTAQPIIAQETVFEYQPSEYEILVPKKIIFTENNIKKTDGNGFTAAKNTRVSFDYSKFRKTTVDVQIIDEP